MSETATITQTYAQAITDRLIAGKGVRRRLPGDGRIHIDRELPFLCLYRPPSGAMDQGTDTLVTSEGAYLIASGDRRERAGLALLVESLARGMTEAFGAYLVLEIWAKGTKPTTLDASDSSDLLRPAFRILIPKQHHLGAFVDRFDQSLARLRIGRQAAEVTVTSTNRTAPPGMAPVLPYDVAGSIGCVLVGLEVRPIYRDSMKGDLYPLVLRELRRKLTRALRRFFYEFTCHKCTHKPAHFHVLGRRAVVKAVWEVDQRLAEVSSDFDFLLQVTPVNALRAWKQFEASQFQEPPVFYYRPLPVDPVQLKRQLYLTPIEKIEDPALAELFQEKLQELDCQISMLRDINTSRFLPGSIQLYGAVERQLWDLARKILTELPPRTRDDVGGTLNAAAFATLAQEEIEYYRQQSPMNAAVEIRDDIASHLMVSKGNLLINKSARFPRTRAEALLQHEVGTHLLTYYNGQAQPFRQLYTGLAGYESLQEGIAVLAEYLVNGLSRPRLRLLAARVVAVRALIEGASFVEIFRLLRDTYGFRRRVAFRVVVRVYRSGGFAKDAAYLRGLRQVLDYLGTGGTLQPLFVGKIAARHIPIIRELAWRRVLKPAPLRPRYLDAPGVMHRLERLRGGVDVLKLVEKKEKR